MRQPLPWSMVTAQMRRDRAHRPEIREDRIRLQTGAGPRLTAWRGRSGRRYGFTVYPLAEAVALDEPCTFGLLVARDADGFASIVDCGDLSLLSRLLLVVGPCGATELHLHRLAGSDAERRAILLDLGDAPR